VTIFLSGHSGLQYDTGFLWTSGFLRLIPKTGKKTGLKKKDKPKYERFVAV
jgi:hypothetical protein